MNLWIKPEVQEIPTEGVRRLRAKFKAADWRAANPEKAQLIQRRFYLKRGRIHQAEWRAANPEKERSIQKRSYLKHGPARSAEWRASHPEKQEGWRQAALARWNSLPRRQQMLAQAQRRSRRISGVPTTLRLTDIPEVPENCPICHTSMDASSRMKTPSLDRINSQRGYEPGNVAVICLGCNVRKQDSTIEQLEAIIAYMRKNGVNS